MYGFFWQLLGQLYGLKENKGIRFSPKLLDQSYSLKKEKIKGKGFSLHY
jgi:hypothetical protein